MERLGREVGQPPVPANAQQALAEHARAGQVERQVGQRADRAERDRARWLPHDLVDDDVDGVSPGGRNGRLG